MKNYIRTQELKIENLLAAKKVIEDGIEISSINQVKEFNKENQLFTINYEIDNQNALFAYVSFSFLSDSFSDLSFFVSQKYICNEGNFEELDWVNTLGQIIHSIKYMKKHLEDFLSCEDEIRELILLKEEKLKIERKIAALEKKTESSIVSISNSVFAELQKNN